MALRQGLDLYACIRPVRHFEGLETPVKHPERVNMVIFRENTEDVYAGVEFAAATPEARKLIDFLREELGVTKVGEAAAVGIKPMTETGSKRLVRRGAPLCPGQRAGKSDAGAQGQYHEVHRRRVPSMGL